MAPRPRGVFPQFFKAPQTLRVPAPPLDPLLRPDFSPLFSFDEQISPNHGAERFHVLPSGDSFWLRLEGHSDWLAIYDDPNGRLLAIRRSGDTTHLEFSLRQALLRRAWGRTLPMEDENGRAWRVLWKGQQSFLMRPDSGEAAAFSARSNWTRGAWIREGAHFERLLRREWRNPASEVAATRRFLEGNVEERRLFGITWERGSYKELHAVARAGLQIEHPGDERGLEFAQSVQGRGWTVFPEHLEGGRLSRVWWKALERNPPLCSGRFAQRRLAPRPFAFHPRSDGHSHLIFSVDPPSQHERLEARLYLQDWLRRYAPELLNEWAE